MYSLFGGVLLIASAALLFAPRLVTGPLRPLLLIGAVIWFAISRWIKRAAAGLAARGRSPVYGNPDVRRSRASRHAATSRHSLSSNQLAAQSANSTA